jgi:hypothetical protein
VRVPLALAAAAALLSLAGCGLRRAVTIDSSPSGAKLWVNGMEHGATPQRVPYVRDALFTVRLEKDGYESIADEFRTTTETDAVPGPDFFAEHFGPRRERVTAKHYDLVPLRRSAPSKAEIDAEVDRARAFRSRTAREIAEPGTPTPEREHPPPPSSTTTAPTTGSPGTTGTTGTAGTTAPPKPSAQPVPPPPPPPPSPLPPPSSGSPLPPPRRSGR